MEFDLFGERRSPDASGLVKGGGFSKRELLVVYRARELQNPKPDLVLSSFQKTLFLEVT
jgi:hypothetical protein